MFLYFLLKLTKILVLTFRFLTHLELIFVYGVRCRSHFIFFQKDNQKLTVLLPAMQLSYIKFFKIMNEH